MPQLNNIYLRSLQIVNLISNEYLPIQFQLEKLQTEAISAIAGSSSLDELEQIRVRYLGKKGQLSQILRGMGKLSPEERPAVGNKANVVKEAIQTKLDQQKINYSKQKLPPRSPLKLLTLLCLESVVLWVEFIP